MRPDWRLALLALVTLCATGAAATRATAQDKVTLRYALEVERQINEEEESRNLTELRAKGRTVVVPDDLGPYQKAVQAVYEQYGKGIGPEKIRQIQALR